MNAHMNAQLNTDRNGKWKELRTLLQIVALPVTGQMRLVSNDCCRLELLARKLRSWRRELPAELAATLTPEQEDVLAQLERQLARTCREPVSPRWTERAMRRSAGVREARRLARAALLRFGWWLELPAHDLLQRSGLVTCV